MAHSLPCRLLVSATLLLLLPVAPGHAQETKPGNPPSQPEPSPAAKELSATQVDVMIERAFGAGCKELQRPLRLWIRDRSSVISAGEFTIEKDGSVRLIPFSAALFGDDGKPTQTVRGDSAVIKLDAPITGFAGLATSKIVALDVIAGGGFTFSFPTVGAKLAVDLPPVKFTGPISHPRIDPKANASSSESIRKHR